MTLKRRQEDILDTKKVTKDFQLCHFLGPTSQAREKNRAIMRTEYSIATKIVKNTLIFGPSRILCWTSNFKTRGSLDPKNSAVIGNPVQKLCISSFFFD